MLCIIVLKEVGSMNKVRLFGAVLLMMCILTVPCLAEEEHEILESGDWRYMLKTGDIPLRYCTMRKLEEVSPITFISKNANTDLSLYKNRHIIFILAIFKKANRLPKSYRSIFRTIYSKRNK